MDRQLLERLIGAGVLVVALVVIVPAILDVDREGGDEAEHESEISTSADEPRRTHTIRLDQSTQSPPVARVVERPASEKTNEAGGGNGSEPKPVAPSPKPRSGVTEAPPVVNPDKAAQTPSKQPLISKPTPVEPESVPKTGWVVQLGSFSSRTNAQQLADEVGGRGYPVFLMSVERSGKKLYRVRVGPRDTREQANELASRLEKSGYSGQVTQ